MGWADAVSFAFASRTIFFTEARPCEVWRPCNCIMACKSSPSRRDWSCNGPTASPPRLSPTVREAGTSAKARTKNVLQGTTTHVPLLWTQSRPQPVTTLIDEDQQSLQLSSTNAPHERSYQLESAGTATKCLVRAAAPTSRNPLDGPWVTQPRSTDELFEVSSEILRWSTPKAGSAWASPLGAATPGYGPTLRIGRLGTPLLALLRRAEQSQLHAVQTQRTKEPRALHAPRPLLVAPEAMHAEEDAQTPHPSPRRRSDLTRPHEKSRSSSSSESSPRRASTPPRRAFSTPGSASQEPAPSPQLA